MKQLLQEQHALKPRFLSADAEVNNGLAAANRSTAVLLGFGYALALFHRTAFQAIGPQVSAECGMSTTATADLAAAFFWAYLVLMIPTGLLTDVVGARCVAVLGFVVTAAGSFLFCFSDSFVELTLGRLLIAAGSPAAFVGLMRFVALAFAERKATVSGRVNLLGNFGAMCSGAPLVLLLGVASWRDVWLGLGILSLALAAALYLLSRDMRPSRPCLTPPRGPWRELITLLGSRSVLLSDMGREEPVALTGRCRSAPCAAHLFRLAAAEGAAVNRTRKGLGVLSPLAVCHELLLNSPRHPALVN